MLALTFYAEAHLLQHINTHSHSIDFRYYLYEVDFFIQ